MGFPFAAPSRLLFKHLTEALDNLQNNQKYLQRLKRKLKQLFAPKDFETVKLFTGQRVAGIVLHEQRFVFIFHNILLRGPLSIVDVAPSREGVGAYRTTHLIHLGMAQASRLGPCRRQHIGRSGHVPPP